ncbi:MAG: archaellin/type IV pilin N-terminal domain-containing protein [Euryarchaeota archaeon]|nr:archaellin/type IV pilin N-terminal domain-containing protein [Euryarchaeota archaeon]
MKMRLFNNKLLKDERAFTGLEAAIVLTAFVVVAAVFSYVVLGAGFFTSEKSKEVIHTGVDQATSSLEIGGYMAGHGWNYSYVNGSENWDGLWNATYESDDNYWSYYAWNESNISTQYVQNTTHLTVVEIQVELAAGQNPVDMDKIVISYSDVDTYVAQVDAVTTANATKGNFTVTSTSGQWAYSLLTSEAGTSNMLDPTEKMLIMMALPAWGVGAYDEFVIDIKPGQGATLTVTKTAPGSIQKTMVLN